MNSIELLETLVAFPTISADENLMLIGFVRDFLQQRGFACEIFPDQTGMKANLFATIGPRTDNGIVLSGHTDVVPVAGQMWTSDPFVLTRKGDRLFGRGAADMKGFLACALRAADIATHATLARPLHIAFSHDEEIGCVGVRSLLDVLVARKFRASLCVVGEPTSMQLALGHKGKLAARATCHGVAGHSSMAPNFLNAIHLASDFIRALRLLQIKLAAHETRDQAYDIPYSTIHAGVIAGGVALNIVADTAIVDFEIRNLAETDIDGVLADIRDAAAAITASLKPTFPQASIDIAMRNVYPGLSTAADASAVAFMQKLLPDSATTKVSYGTEAGLFASRLGLETIVVGPGSMDQGHTPDEFIDIEQLQHCEAMLGGLVAALSRP